MGFRFRRSVRLFPGVRLNFSLSGVSVSAGVPGAMVNIGPRGGRVTVGLPGTGISYVHHLNSKQNSRSPAARRDDGILPSVPAPGAPNECPKPALVGEIKSANVADLTSPDLQGLKNLINEAAHQRSALLGDLSEAVSDRRRAWRKLRRREQWPLRVLMKSSIPTARTAFEEAEEEAQKVAQAIGATEIKMAIDLDPPAWSAWIEVQKAFERLSQTAKFWDVTSSVAVDRFRTRSAASDDVTRTLVGLRPVDDGIVATPGGGYRFENANGGDLDLFPGFMLIRDKAGSDYALIDIRDLTLDACRCRFIERDPVPPDAEIVGHAWHRSNKDGSPDRRFSQNYQIPIAQYGEMRFSTRNGVKEAYNASNYTSAVAFAQAAQNFQDALRRQAEGSKPAIAPTPIPESGPKDPAAFLPALPNVWGAYEVVAIPILLAGFLAYTSLADRPVTDRAAVSPATINTATAVAAPTEATTPLPIEPALAPAARSVPGEPLTPAPMASFAPALVSVATPIAERMMARQNANVRANPDRAAASLRVVQAGTTVSVFEKRGSWVRIGDRSPWGWTHASLLRPL